MNTKDVLAQKFNFASLLRFAMPSIIMMMVMGLYSIVDSIFVSRFVGTNALSAINIVYPFINLLIGLGVMMATGGSAIMALKMGEGKPDEARSCLSLFVIVGTVAGAVIGIAGLIFINPLVKVMGASDILLNDAKTYLGILLAFAPANILQMMFQMYFVTAGRPNLGLALTIGAGVVNTILDFLFVVPLQMGLVGAALATGIGYLIPAVAGIVFFLRRNKPLYFARPVWSIKALLRCCSNGSSEMVSNISTGIVTLVFNLIMMRFLKEDGVAAVTIVMYAQFLMASLFMGFSMGVSPIISYRYGERDSEQLQKIFKYCTAFLTVVSISIFTIAMLLGPSIALVFAPKSSDVYKIAVYGFLLFPICFLFQGFNIHASAMFTAYGNGKVSALLSLLRTFVFVLAGLIFLPQLFGIEGVWLAVPVAELCALVVSIVFTYKYRYEYHLKR